MSKLIEFILSIFSHKKVTHVTESGGQMADKLISLKDYLTASGKYPDREKHPELTPQLISNAEALLKQVNALLDELGMYNVKVSSGFRPQSVNSKTKGAATKSLHTVCKAIDIEDPGQHLSATVFAKHTLLTKYGLWLEDPSSTPTWMHCDIGQRSDRPIRVFKP